MRGKRFLCLFCAAVLLAACARVNSVPASRIVTANMPQILNIYSPNAFQNVVGLTDQAALDAWNSYMSDAYGAQINLKTELDMAYNPTGSSSGNPLGMVVAGALTGMVELGPGEIISYLESESHPSYILPLDEYLADNKTWNSLPGEFRNRFERDGHIWAIPKKLTSTLQVTSINTNWLKKVGAQLPASAEELAATAKLFVQNDANGDGEKNDYLLSTVGAVDHTLYASFGVYLSGYNPNDNYFSEPRRSKGAADLFRYMQSLYQAGCLGIDSFYTATVAMDNPEKYATVQTSPGMGKYGAAFNLARSEGKSEDKLLTDYEKIAGTFEAIPPFSDDNPLTYTDDGSCFVLVDGTTDPGPVVNAFVDLAFGSIQSYLDLTVGIPDNYKIGSNKTITLNYTDAENRILPLCPNLVETMDLIDKGWIVVNPDQNEKLARKLKEDAKSYEDSYIAKYTQSGRLLKLPVWYLYTNRYSFMELRDLASGTSDRWNYITERYNNSAYDVLNRFNRLSDTRAASPQ